jgi:hypothetical protein
MRVKLEVDRLAIVPDAPPAAGPERALDPPLRAMGCPKPAELLAAEPLLAVVLRMPAAPAPIAIAAATTAIGLVNLWKYTGDLSSRFGVRSGWGGSFPPHPHPCTFAPVSENELHGCWDFPSN